MTDAKYFEERAAANALKSGKPRVPAEVVQLPLWPDAQRAAPNVMLRSALFSVVKKGKRRLLKAHLVASWPGSTIHFTGEQLDQFDETVWFEVIHLAAEQSRNQTVAQFKLGAFLKRIGVKKNGPSMKRLDEAFTRMIACEVDIETPGCVYRDNLLGLHVDKSTGVYTLRLNPALVQLFNAGHTRVEWRVRHELKTDLARWLHGFVLSHRADEKKPQRIAVERLKELAGVSDTRALKLFRFDLRTAMAQLQEFGIVKSWRITDTDALEFARRKRSK